MPTPNNSAETLPKHPDADNTQEETWEEANCSAAEYTPHSSQRIHFFSPLKEGAFMDIKSVDTSSMSLLDVCNYTVEEEEVDGSGHCVWMGALFFVHALSIGLAATDKTGDNEDSSQSSWCNSHEYFLNRTVAEMGCGTGAAGIGLLKIFLSQGSLLPKSMTFLDNDPEALELCRRNCQHNGIHESLYHIQLQQPWADLSNNAESTCEENFHFDTLLATDVLYDLKIIRPFLQTASRFLQKGSKSASSDEESKRRSYLILSHVPRWFLPRQENDNNKEPYNASLALEEHILQEASQFGFQLTQTIRPKDIMTQYDSSINATMNETKPELVEILQEMEGSNAVLWVLALATETNS